MNNRAKLLLTLFVIVFIIFVCLRLTSNWTKAVMEGKPNGPYYSTISVIQAKKENVWLATYLPDSKKYFI